MDSRDLPRKLVLGALLLVALTSGCATSPIGVKRMDPVAVHRSLTASVLTESRPSLDSNNVLERRHLHEKFAASPVWTLAELHRLAVAENDDDTYFALAELSFLYSQKSGDRAYAMMAAAYAWAFLFEGHPLQSWDPRLRLATDIYNRGLTEGLTLRHAELVTLGARSIDLPIGHLDVIFDESQLQWNGRVLRDFVPVAELEVHGLNYRFRTPGIGAPLAASAAIDHPDADAANDEFLAPRLKTPVTALVRVDGIRRQFAQRRMVATLELHSDPNEETVRIHGHDVPLEKEPSAVLASMVAEIPSNRLEIAAFLGNLTQSLGQGRLVALRPHVRGRIPVVFVHGTASNPVRWAEMVNVLDNDPRINQRYEPWFFAYLSSSPIPYSSHLLRDKLQKAVQALDPQGTDPGLQQMVVIGHSQGGLLTKMTAVSSGNTFWEGISKKPFEDIRLKEKDRELLRSVIFVEPLPFVRRVVFLCTPHRGSFVARADWIRGLVTRLISLPARVTMLTADLLTLNPDIAALASIRNVNAVDNMTPGNRFVKTLAGIPIAPQVTANSIIAVLGEGPLETLNDGVVEYSSAHIEGVESEKVVHSSHSTQALPETIEEVRRILLEHAAVADPAPQAVAAKSAATGAR